MRRSTRKIPRCGRASRITQGQQFKPFAKVTELWPCHPLGLTAQDDCHDIVFLSAFGIVDNEALASPIRAQWASGQRRSTAMAPITRDTITAAEAFVKAEMSGNDGSHDWWHIHRCSLSCNNHSKKLLDVALASTRRALHMRHAHKCHLLCTQCAGTAGNAACSAAFKRRHTAIQSAAEVISSGCGTMRWRWRSKRAYLPPAACWWS